MIREPRARHRRSSSVIVWGVQNVVLASIDVNGQGWGGTEDWGLETGDHFDRQSVDTGETPVHTVLRVCTPWRVET